MVPNSPGLIVPNGFRIDAAWRNQLFQDSDNINSNTVIVNTADTTQGTQKSVNQGHLIRSSLAASLVRLHAVEI